MKVKHTDKGGVYLIAEKDFYEIKKGREYRIGDIVLDHDLIYVFDVGFGVPFSVFGMQSTKQILKIISGD